MNFTTTSDKKDGGLKVNAETLRMVRDMDEGGSGSGSSGSVFGLNGGGGGMLTRFCRLH